MTTDRRAVAPLRRVVAFLVLVAAAGMAAWGTRIDLDETLPLWELAIVVAVLPLSELAPLHVRFGHHNWSFTWGEATVVLALVLVGPAWLVLLSAPLVAFAHLVARRGWVKAMANAAVFSIGVSIAGLVLAATSGLPFRLTDPFDALALLVAVTSYTVVSAVGTGLLVAAARGTELWSVVRSTAGVVAVVWAGNIAVASGVLLLAERSPSTVLGLPAVLLAVYVLYRSYLAAAQERDVWQQLEAATRELSALDEREVAAAALRRAAQLFRPDGVELLATGGRGPGRLYTLDAQGELVRREVPAPTGQADATTYVELDTAGAAERTCLAAPLEGPRGRVGSLRLLFGGRVRLSDRERQVLSTFAHAVSTTLLNAALYEDARSEAALKAYEATHDLLTGLGNRSLLAARTEEAVAAGAATTAILLLDLDHFKEINDTLGHAAGDQLLQEVGRRLEGVAGESDLVARLGGDEFAVLLVGLGTPDAAGPVAEQVLRRLAEPFEIEGLRLSVEASLGVATHPQDAETPEELFRRADVAMYQAKEAARGSWLRYNAERDDSSVQRQALVAELRAALELDEIVVQFQPQIDLDHGLVSGAEALCRWEHPTRGLLMPAEFVGVAEQSGLVRQFTLRVLDQAVAACAGWQEEGRPVSVSVNMSARSLLDRQLPRDIRGVLDRHGLPPDRLVVEITETTATSELEVVEDVLTAIRELGAEISVDDFGTGYSSLSFLQRTAVHELKVDRTFVTGMLTSESDLALVRATVQLARSLGARSVAEGVEDGTQAAALRDMGCDVAQGYWLSRPVSATELRRLLGLRVIADSGRSVRDVGGGPLRLVPRRAEG